MFSEKHWKPGLELFSRFQPAQDISRVPHGFTTSLDTSSGVYHVLKFNENSLVGRNLYQLMTKLMIS